MESGQTLRLGVQKIYRLESHRIVGNDDIPVDVMVKKIEKIEKEVKFNAFGKSRMNKHVKQNVKTTNLSVDKEEADRNLIQKKSFKIEKQILNIKSQNLGRVGSLFKMRDAINGPKKDEQDPTAVRDPKSDELIVSNDEIKKGTLA